MSQCNLSVSYIFKHIPVASFVELCGLRNVLFAMCFFLEKYFNVAFFYRKEWGKKDKLKT